MECTVFFPSAAQLMALPAILCCCMTLTACVALDLPDADEWGESRSRPVSAGIGLSEHSAISLTYLPREARRDESVVGAVHMIERHGAQGAPVSHLLFAVRKVRGGYMSEAPLLEAEDHSLSVAAGYNREHSATVGLFWRWRF